jgi:hypothetical protein
MYANDAWWHTDDIVLATCLDIFCVHLMLNFFIVLCWHLACYWDG